MLELRLKESDNFLLWSSTIAKIWSRDVETGSRIIVLSLIYTPLLETPSKSRKHISFRWVKKNTQQPLSVQMLSEDLLVLGS